LNSFNFSVNSETRTGYRFRGSARPARQIASDPVQTATPAVTLKHRKVEALTLRNLSASEASAAAAQQQWARFISELFATYLATHGLPHTRSAPYHPMTHGAIGRENPSISSQPVLIVTICQGEQPWFFAARQQGKSATGTKSTSRPRCESVPVRIKRRLPHAERQTPGRAAFATPTTRGLDNRSRGTLSPERSSHLEST
jgi:hypothetical protein